MRYIVRPPGAEPVFLRFNYDAHTKAGVVQPITSSLITLLLTPYITL